MERMNLTLEIRPNEIGAKHINVRSSLVIANLIAEIQDKFNLDGTLQLELQGQAGPLSLAAALNRSGVADGSTLICDRVMEDTGTMEAIQRGVRHALEGKFKRIYLTEQRTLTEYDVEWQPAILGRKDHANPSNNRLLAVDLESVEDLPTVSRQHACITLDRGSIFVESIQARNPTYLDGARLKPGIRYPLNAGSAIQVGRVTLTFNIIS